MPTWLVVPNIKDAQVIWPLDVG